MRYHDLHLQRVGLAVGAERQLTSEALADGRYSPREAARTGQVSRAAAPGWTGPALATVAGHRALGGTDRSAVALHLHATINDSGHDFWAPNCGVASDLGLRGGMTLEIGAMSNSLCLGMELAASTLSAWRDASALVTAGDVFAPPRFDPWSADVGMVYGDAGAAYTLGRTPGLARLLASATSSDPRLERLNRGVSQPYANAVVRPPIELGAHKRAAAGELGGTAEVDRRNGVCVAEAVAGALDDAEVTLGDVAAVFAPHYGQLLLQRHVLSPLGVGSSDRTGADYGAEVGHLGAADQIAALHRWCSQGRLDPGDVVLLLGIGVGMTHTAILVEITDPAALHPDSAAPHNPAPAGETAVPAPAVPWEVSA